MENIIQKCSSIQHHEINATSFCQECRIYMCNKCLILHSDEFKNHHIINSENNINEIFTGFCKIKNHQL